MTTIINTKLGEHRGKKRIWLEGRKLEREGYGAGTHYRPTFGDHRVVLSACNDGRYVVSKRERDGRTIPIIDLGMPEIAAVFSGVEILRVAIQSGTIIITAHHQQRLVGERVARLVDKIQSGQKLSVCSLFHGGGVLDKAIHSGLARAGIRSSVGVAVEINEAYLDASLRNNGELWDQGSIVIESPIQAIDLRRNPPQSDILVGGIPCTGASKSGRTKNKLEFAESHKDAGAMFFHFLQFVQAVNPAIVIIENVPEYQHTASMEVIRSVLASLGYSLQERVMDGNEFGVLERRKRLCAVALSSGLNGRFDLGSVQPLRKKDARISDVLDEVPLDSPRWKPFDYLRDKQERDAAAGKGFTRQLLTGAEDHCGTIGKDYAKCRSTEPFIVHPRDQKLSRILTPAEHCRVKGIPEEVIAGLSDTTAHQILGQSVIFPMFEAVAAALGSALDALRLPLAA